MLKAISLFFFLASGLSNFLIELKKMELLFELLMFGITSDIFKLAGLIQGGIA